MSEVDHFEALFDATYLRWFHLDGPVLAEITKIERNVELTLRGGAKKKSSLVHFKLINGKMNVPVRPFVLNKTNAESIAEIHGKQPSHWIGKQIVFYQSATQLGKKKDVECIRIRAAKTGATTTEKE